MPPEIETPKEPLSPPTDTALAASRNREAINRLNGVELVSAFLNAAQILIQNPGLFADLPTCRLYNDDQSKKNLPEEFIRIAQILSTSHHESNPTTYEQLQENIANGKYPLSMLDLATFEIIMILKREADRSRIRTADATVKSTTDQLTGLPNRRGFDTEIARVMALSRREKVPVSIAYIDLDGLKHVNDTYGHTTGDEYIKVASEIFKRLRGNDIVCRLSGDEFVIIFVGTNVFTEDSNSIPYHVAISERLRNEPSGFLFNGDPNQPIKVNFSIGFSTIQPDDTVELLLHRAEQAMQDEKRKRKLDLSLHIRQ